MESKKNKYKINIMRCMEREWRSGVIGVMEGRKEGVRE